MREVRTHTLLRHIPELSSPVLSQWVQHGYVEPMRGEGYNGYRVYSQEQYVKARYMAYLVYKMGFTPKAASDIADIALKQEIVQRNLVWIAYSGAMIGIPILGENSI